MSYIIGADVGSQSVKALLMDSEGAEVATAAVACEMHYPSAGWAEQDARDWQRALAGAVRTVTASAEVSPNDVTTLALACQVDGLVPVGANLEPLRPAIIWLDRRATEQSAKLCAAVGEDELTTRTGL